MGKFTPKYLLFLLPIICIGIALIRKTKPLDGAVEVAPNTVFSIKNWFSGSFQKEKEAYLNDNFRGRPYAVRLHNQYEYSCFGNIYARDVVEGKNGYLFEKGYISSYCGRDFKSEKANADAMVERTQKLSDWLHSKGKELIIIVAPSKASFTPENIPAEMSCEPTSDNGYQYSINLLRQTNINVIDLSAYFKAQKKQALYPLFTAYGVHWSSYGAAIAFDTTSHYIAKKLNTQLPDFKINAVKTTCDCTDDTDCDLMRGMNLWKPKKLPEKRAIPNISWNETPVSSQNALFIADSFMWNWVYLYFPHKVFNDYDFWFYNNESWAKNGDYHKKNELNIAKAIEKSNLVILLGTEFHLPNVGYGFQEEALKVIDVK